MAETNFDLSQSVIKKEYPSAIRDYGDFQVVRFGHLRIIPNDNAQTGRLLKNVTTVELDAEDLPSEQQWVEIRLCTGTTGKQVHMASLCIDPILGLSSTVGYRNTAYNTSAVRASYNPTTTSLYYLGSIIWYV